MAHKQLTVEQRYQIAILIDSFSKKDIALKLGVHKATISREIQKNSTNDIYDPDKAQKMRNERKKNSNNARKISDDTWDYVRSLLSKYLSPEQIVGRLRKEQDIRLCHESIYLYIYRIKKAGDDFCKYLRSQKTYRKRAGAASDRRGYIKDAVNISERPVIVNAKQRRGDFEGDTIIGKNHKGGIVTLVDRSSLYLLAMPFKTKQAEVVENIIVNLLTPHKSSKCHTLTFDNGKEFSNHKSIANKLNVQVFFANPYSSWERGANENTNGLLRQFFPKGMLLDNLTNEEVQIAVENINHRPRKILGYKSAYEHFYKVNLRYTDNLV